MSWSASFELQHKRGFLVQNHYYLTKAHISEVNAKKEKVMDRWKEKRKHLQCEAGIHRSWNKQRRQGQTQINPNFYSLLE